MIPPPGFALGETCAPRDAVLVAASGEIVLVGTVTGTENDGRTAHVRVEEVWRGDGIPGDVTVYGGSDPGTTSATDRAYGQLRYLFDLTRAGDRLTDSACSGTTPWRDDLAVLRPRGVRAIVGANAASGIALGQVVAAVAAVAAVVIILLALVALRRRGGRAPGWKR